MKNPIVEIIIKKEIPNKIVVELYPDKAPNTVNNFVDLVESGFYNGLPIHRIVKDWVIQTGETFKEPEFSIKGEFKENGFDNPVIHEKGAISMARWDGLFDSAGTHFFITFRATPELDGKYSAFGKMLSGFEVMEELEKVPVDETKGRSCPPFDPPIIEKITLISNGNTFEKPIRIYPAQMPDEEREKYKK